jgi:hypothetical protein
VRGDDLITALDLPPAARVDRRIPKKLLLENGAPTAADRRLISESIESLVWVAALKPATVGVTAWVDETHEYLEIAVIAMTVREQAKLARLVNLVHRAIPYPALLIVADERQVGLSAVHKRRSLGEAGRVVLDEDNVWVSVDDAADAAWLPAFQDAIALSRQPRTSMWTLYQGWIDTLVALVAARLTGTFSIPASAPEAGARRAATSAYERTEAEIGRVRRLAARETQVSRQVELNQQLARLRATLTETRTKL